MAGSDVTGLLHAWAGGDAKARDQLVPVVYAELRRRAAAHLRRERRQTLQPTDLVHEAYLRLVNQQRAVWKNRAQFFAVAAEIMRRVLVDRARAHLAAKRSGQWSPVTLDPSAVFAEPIDVDVLDLDAALSRLAEIDPRKSRIAELRFFGGLSLEEAGEVLDVSLATVERDWQFARAWLFDALSARLRDARETGQLRTRSHFLCGHGLSLMRD
jgi:RNA polymerase sigma factor (TIGR02999 family)